MVCICFALAVNKRVEMGFVHLPVRVQLFSAQRGKGAFLNEKQKLKVKILCVFYCMT